MGNGEQELTPLLGVGRKAWNRRRRKLGLSRLDAGLLEAGRGPAIKRGLSGLRAGEGSGIKRGLSGLSPGRM